MGGASLGRGEGGLKGRRELVQRVEFEYSSVVLLAKCPGLEVEFELFVGSLWRKRASERVSVVLCMRQKLFVVKCGSVKVKVNENVNGNEKVEEVNEHEG